MEFVSKARTPHPRPYEFLYQIQESVVVKLACFHKPGQEPSRLTSHFVLVPQFLLGRLQRYELWKSMSLEIDIGNQLDRHATVGLPSEVHCLFGLLLQRFIMFTPAIQEEVTGREYRKFAGSPGEGLDD